MALKALLLGQQIRMKEAELETLRARDAEFSTREAELEQAIGEVETDEQRSAVETMVSEFEAQRDAHVGATAALESELETLRSQLAEIEKTQPPAPQENRGAEHHNEEARNMIPTYDIRSIRKLPIGQNAFEVIPFAERQRIVGTPQVKDFLTQIRGIIENKRSVTGADLSIPLEFLDIIRENMYRYSKLLRRVRVRNGRGVGRELVAGLVQEAIWTECCGALNELRYKYSALEVDCYKVGGFVPLCNSLMEESDLDLASEVIEMVSQSIGYAIDKAILYGRPNLKMPTGIVPSLAQQSQPADWPATAPAWEDLHTSNIITINGLILTGAAFWAALRMATAKAFSRYARGEQFWCMNSITKATLESKAIATTLTGEWVSILGGKLPIVSGDIEVLEFIPDGDIIGGYGELYLLRRHSGTQIGADETGHYNRINDITLLWGKTRADGKPIIRRSFVAININNTSVTTEMTFAGDIANDATLEDLTVGALSLSPSFDEAVQTYTASAANNVTSAAVTATPAQDGAEVSISVTSGTTTKKVINGGTAALAVGDNVIAVTVKKGNATVVYTVTVTRAAS